MTHLHTLSAGIAIGLAVSLAAPAAALTFQLMARDAHYRVPPTSAAVTVGCSTDGTTLLKGARIFTYEVTGLAGVPAARIVCN